MAFEIIKLTYLLTYLLIAQQGWPPSKKTNNRKTDRRRQT